jgi:hypothetical protein
VENKRKRVSRERVKARLEESMRSSPAVKVLEERIAYHRAKSAEERGAGAPDAG